MTVGTESAVVQQNSQKAQDYTTVAAVVGISAFVFAVPATRDLVLGVHNSSLVGALLVYGAAVALAWYSYKSLMNTAEWRGGGVAGILNSNEAGFHGDKVQQDVQGYFSNFGEQSRKEGGDHDALLTKRKENYMQMVNSFYTLVTDFYEYGWGTHTDMHEQKRTIRCVVAECLTVRLPCFCFRAGDSFHFANRFIGESHKESLRRAEYFLASKLQLNESSRVLDIGCGIGGPMRAIARFCNAEVTGINNCDYQVRTRHAAACPGTGADLQ